MRTADLSTQLVQAFGAMTLGELADTFLQQMNILNEFKEMDRFAVSIADKERRDEAMAMLELINAITQFRFGILFGIPD